MTRISTVTREDVPDDQLEVFDQFVEQRGNVPTTGPFSMMLYAPEMLARGERLRAYLSGEESSLPGNIRWLAILVTAREMDCQFIWHVNIAFGRQSGLSDALVDNLRDKKPLTGLSSQESTVLDYGREFFRTRRVSQGTFDAALGHFGARGLTELTTLMGYYTLLAFNINAFEVGLPEESTETPLPV